MQEDSHSLLRQIIQDDFLVDLLESNPIKTPEEMRARQQLFDAYTEKTKKERQLAEEVAEKEREIAEKQANADIEIRKKQADGEEARKTGNRRLKSSSVLWRCLH